MIQNTGKKSGTAASIINANPWDDQSWQNATGAFTPGDSSRAYITVSSFDINQKTSVLKIRGYDFSEIPDGATILGVILYYTAKYANGSVSAGYARLLNTSNVPVGDNVLAGVEQALTTSDVEYSIGSSINLWGNVLTPSWVKNANFGVGFGAIATANDADVHVDGLQLDIYYDDGTTTSPPTTVVVTTLSPTTIFPTTLAPTSLAPTTLIPSTIAPSSLAPSTLQPSTQVPTTLSPTTLEPTTLSPTTLTTSTLLPTTLAPTTIGPTTLSPTTLFHSTVPPTTLVPTTQFPICPTYKDSIISDQLLISSIIQDALIANSLINDEVYVNSLMC